MLQEIRVHSITILMQLHNYEYNSETKIIIIIIINKVHTLIQKDCESVRLKK